MSNFTDNRSNRIDMIFVFALVTLFAATSFILVLIGAKQYRFVTNTMNENYETRTTSSYLTEKIRQYDIYDAITVSNLEGTPALSIHSVEDDISFVTYIYYYDGSLRELVVTENSVFSLDSGQEIIDMKGFNPTLVNDALLSVEVTDTTGNTQVLYFNLHCSSRKDAS